MLITCDLSDGGQVVDINGPLTRGGPTAQSQKPLSLKKVIRYEFLKKYFIILYILYNFIYFFRTAPDKILAWLSVGQFFLEGGDCQSYTLFSGFVMRRN
jgi:hypothetical protein